MSQDEQDALLIQKYLLDVHNQSLTIKEILSRPRWKRVMYVHRALAKYEGYQIKFSEQEYKDIYGDDRG